MDFAVYETEIEKLSKLTTQPLEKIKDIRVKIFQLI